MEKNRRREEIVDTLQKMSSEGGHLEYFSSYTSPEKLNPEIFPKDFIDAAKEIDAADCNFRSAKEQLMAEYEISDEEVDI